MILVTVEVLVLDLNVTLGGLGLQLEFDLEFGLKLATKYQREEELGDGHSSSEPCHVCFKTLLTFDSLNADSDLVSQQSGFC